MLLLAGDDPSHHRLFHGRGKAHSCQRTLWPFAREGCQQVSAKSDHDNRAASFFPAVCFLPPMSSALLSSKMYLVHKIIVWDEAQTTKGSSAAGSKADDDDVTPEAAQFLLHRPKRQAIKVRSYQRIFSEGRMLLF